MIPTAKKVLRMDSSLVVVEEEEQEDIVLETQRMFSQNFSGIWAVAVAVLVVEVSIVV